MNIAIVAVGRMRAGPEKQLFDSYVSKTPWTVTTHEIEARGKGDAIAQAKQEADGILSVLPQSAKVICLDSRGKTLTSEKLAQRFGQWRDGGERDVAFVIGGADGLEARVIQKADLVLSFGAVTWPHMLMRVLVSEQIFRAHCILTGHPYHRGH